MTTGGEVMGAKLLPSTVLAIVLASFPALAQESQSGGQSGTGENSHDVPHQQPGTNSPDVGKQREPSPKAPEDSTHSSGDVPHQNPGTNNPDVSKQRRSTKKGKQNKSTGTSTQP